MRVVLVKIIRSIQRKKPSNMKSALRFAKSLMPAGGDVNAFAEAVAVSRGRPIYVLDLPVQPTSPSGGWFARESDDYLVVDVASTQSRRAAIICHELAHILLGHKGDPLDSDQLSILAPTMDPLVAARFLGGVKAWKQRAGVCRLGVVRRLRGV